MIRHIKLTSLRRAFFGAVLSTSLLLSQSLHAYVTLNGGTVTDYTLKSDTTYLVTGTFRVNHLKIEGGAVVKMENNVYARIEAIDTVECQTEAYRPAVFTTRNDSSVGEHIYPGGSVPSNRLSTGLALPWYHVQLIEVRHLRFAHQAFGIFTDWGNDVTVRDCQFVSCSTAVQASGTDINLKVYNCLVWGDKQFYAAFGSWDGGFLDAQHVTVHHVGVLSGSWDSAVYKNSLVVDLTRDPGTLGDGSINLWDQLGSTVFESVGAGGHYLPASSPYRNSGTPSIANKALASITKGTTDSPLQINNTTLAPSTTWTPLVAPDTDWPDIGYHYPPMDYLVSEVTMNGPLTLSGGVVVGIYGNEGLKYGHGPLTSDGTACSPNRIVWYPTVQEGSLGNIALNVYVHALNLASASGTTASLGADIRFTKFNTLCHPWYFHIRSGNNDLVPSIAITDCEFDSRGYVIAYEGSHTTIANCLFDRAWLWFDSGELPQDVTVEARNCLFRGALVYLLGEDKNRHVFKENLFDQPNFYGILGTTHSHNGCTVGTVSLGGVGDVINIPADYQEAWAGRFYYTSTMNALLNAGSRSAVAAGVDDQTTQVDQTTDSGTVDIGYHYPVTGPEISTWTFTDEGFVLGGQDGAFRQYNDPTSVTASPWSFQSADGSSLRMSFEDDVNCASPPVNPYNQFGTAEAQILVHCPTRMFIEWNGIGEQESPNFELMSLFVDSNFVGSAHAPGGNLDCAPMAPVVSDPEPPQFIDLQPGMHTLTIQTETGDELFHIGAYYQFNLRFERLTQ